MTCPAPDTTVRSASSQKHSILLLSLVGMLVVEPFLAARHLLSIRLTNAVLVAVYFYVFFVIFRRGWQRRIALALFVPAAVTKIGMDILLTSALRTTLAAVWHSFAAVFLGFAVVVVLRGLFHTRTIRVDDVLGAVCGYVMAGLLWGHLYTLTYMFVPASIGVSPAIAAQVDDAMMHHTLFDYLSFTTLTSIGFADMTPAGPPMYSLTWLETMFGQFYLAVVVAQLVGLKIAQRVGGAGGE